MIIVCLGSALAFMDDQAYASLSKPLFPHQRHRQRAPRDMLGSGELVIGLQAAKLRG
jgi:hypothetical protein